MEDRYKHPAHEKKVRFRLNLLNTRKESKRWIIIITFVSFILSAVLSLISTVMENAQTFVAVIILFIIVIINIIFDIIGTAVTAADEAPFHAMASRKLYGAREGIGLIRNADKVSNFCNDVVGDICGVISGAASTYIIVKLAGSSDSVQNTIIGLLITGLLASSTVGGKALGKTIAIENSNYIIYKVGILLKFVSVRTGVGKKRKKRKNGRKRDEN